MALAQYLPLHGFEPIILCAGGDTPWLYLDDTVEVPDVEVIRVDAGDLNELFAPKRTSPNTRLRTAFRALFRTDYMANWADRAAQVAEKIIKEREIEIILTTSPPFSIIKILTNLKRKFPDIMAVTDLRDLFYSLRQDNLVQSLRRAIALPKIERNLHAMDIIVGASPGFKEELGKLELPVYTVTNGFEGNIASEDDYTRGEKFRLVHAGSFPSRGRTPKYFIEGLDMACKVNDNFSDKVRVIFAGVEPEVILRHISRFPERSYNLELPGMLPHKEAMKLQKSCEVNLLIETTSEKRGGKAIIPLKLFEQVAARRPILATVVGDGVAAGMVRDMNLGIVCNYDKPDCIRDALLTMFDEWTKEKLRSGALEEVAAEFKFENCISRYAAILKECVN